MENRTNINLQLFAEPNETAPAAEAGATNAAAQSADGEGTAEQTFTQADVDRIVNQRLARAQRDAERRVEQARNEARSEAERLAQMTGEQRLQHEREQAERMARERETSLAEREAEITRRELRIEATDTLISRGLPVDLAEILDFTNADACSASIDRVEKIFRNAVQASVDERLRKSSAPLNRNSADANAALLAQMRRAAGLPD